MKKRSCGRAIAIAAALLLTACGQGTTAATMHLAKARGEVEVADAGGRAVEVREPLGLVTAGEKAELTVRDGMGEITVEPLEEEDIPAYVEEEELPEDAVVEAAPEEGPEDGTLEAREQETVNPESEEPAAEGTEAPEGEEAGGNEPPEMPVDENPIEESALAGSYSPSAGGAALALSIYTDEGDEGEIGVAEGAYSGPIVNVRTNVYRIITDTEEEILLGVSTGEDGSVVIRLYADGAYVDEYVMTEHFES